MGPTFLLYLDKIFVTRENTFLCGCALGWNDVVNCLLDWWTIKINKINFNFLLIVILPSQI